MATEERTLADIADILSIFSQGEKVLGSKKKFIEAIKRLILSNEGTMKNYLTFINYILDCVVYEWREAKVKKAELLKPNTRGEARSAKKMAIILVKQHIDIGNEEISKYFGTRTRQTIYEILTEYNNMNKKIKEHAIFIDKYDRLQIKISNYNIKNNKTIANE
jgi:hypothetical protein